MNDDNYGDNSGSWAACISGPLQRFYRVQVAP